MPPDPDPPSARSAVPGGGVAAADRGGAPGEVPGEASGEAGPPGAGPDAQGGDAGDAGRPAPDPAASPFNPLPPVVWLLLLAMGGVEAVLLAGAHGFAGGPEALGWRLALIQRIGFSGALWEWMVETRRFAPEHLLRLLAYPLVHGVWVQTVFVLVLLAALGKAVGEALGGWALAAVVLAASAGGAAVYGTLAPEAVWLTGGYPAVFGLVGAFALLIWTRTVAEGAGRLRAVALVGVLLGLRVGVGLWFGLSREWIADVAACGIGLALAFVLAPGGWRALLARLRQR